MGCDRRDPDGDRVDDSPIDCKSDGSESVQLERPYNSTADGFACRTSATGVNGFWSRSKILTPRHDSAGNFGGMVCAATSIEYREHPGRDPCKRESGRARCHRGLRSLRSGELLHPLDFHSNYLFVGHGQLPEPHYAVAG